MVAFIIALACLLSTAGVVITAGITMVLCRLVLHISLAESFLIGAVLSSTDAASVFSILRKKKLNLKDGTAFILEVESGSNAAGYGRIGGNCACTNLVVYINENKFFLIGSLALMIKRNGESIPTKGDTMIYS